jgi:hypothetical protein
VSRTLERCGALLDPTRHEVLRVALAPPRLRLLTARLLALGLRANLLPITDTWIGKKPTTARAAGSLADHAPNVPDFELAAGHGRCACGRGEQQGFGAVRPEWQTSLGDAR